MKHPILRKMIPAGMVMVLLAGCGEKKVDYEMEPKGWLVHWMNSGKRITGMTALR